MCMNVQRLNVKMKTVDKQVHLQWSHWWLDTSLRNVIVFLREAWLEHRYLLGDVPWPVVQQSCQAQLGIRMTLQDWTPQGLDICCFLSPGRSPAESPVAYCLHAGLTWMSSLRAASVTSTSLSHPSSCPLPWVAPITLSLLGILGVHLFTVCRWNPESKASICPVRCLVLFMLFCLSISYP